MKQEVVIQGEHYEFCNRIGEDPKLLASFNELAGETFGLYFEQVGEDYEPQVLAKGGRVCANVSVNRIPFVYHGEKRRYLQLGTVMTAREYQNQGLCRFLMTQVLKHWEGKADAIYLFANDSVLDFYPKFGFGKQKEYESCIKKVSQKRNLCRFFDTTETENQELLLKKYGEGNCFAELYMTENRPILDFYYRGCMKDHVYYLEEAGVILVAEQDGKKTVCYEILGKTNWSLEEILAALPFEGTGELTLGFMPGERETVRARKEADETLFLHQSGENLFQEANLMFPLLSHA